MYTDAELRDAWAEEEFARWAAAPPPHAQTPERERPVRRWQPPPENLDRLGHLLQRALWAYRRLLWAQYDEIGLLPSQESLVTELYYLDNPRSQRELAHRAGTSKQAVSRSLLRLEQAGMVERERSPGDRRHGVVRLTKLGKIAMRLFGAALRDAEDAALAGLGARTQRVLERALREIEKNCVAAVDDLREPAAAAERPPAPWPTRWS